MQSSDICGCKQKLLKLLSVERETPGFPGGRGERKGKDFPIWDFVVSGFLWQQLKWSHLFQKRSEGFVQGKVPAMRSSPFPSPSETAPTAMGQALGSSTSSPQMQPISDIYYSKLYFLNSLWAAWSVFWADDKSYFFELHLCLSSYNSRLLLPRKEQCRFFMQNVTVCNLQGTCQFGGFIFSFLPSIKFSIKKTPTLIYPVIFSKEVFRVLISSRLRKNVPKAAFSKSCQDFKKII